jgi:hypothetical protein
LLLDFANGNAIATIANIIAIPIPTPNHITALDMLVDTFSAMVRVCTIAINNRNK